MLPSVLFIGMFTSLLNNLLLFQLALRAGNEKDEDQADTVGCCSLRVEHISLHPEKDGEKIKLLF